MVELFTPLFWPEVKPTQSGDYFTLSGSSIWSMAYFNADNQTWFSNAHCSLLKDRQDLMWFGLCYDPAEAPYVKELLSRLASKLMLDEDKLRTSERRLQEHEISTLKKIVAQREFAFITKIEELKAEVARLTPPPPRADAGPGKYKVRYIWEPEHGG